MLPTAPLISTPSSLLPRSCSPVLSEPIRLPTTRFCGRRRADERDAHLVARDHLRAGGVALDRVGRGVVDAHAFVGVAETDCVPVVSVPIRLSTTRISWRRRRLRRSRRSRCRAGSPRSRCPGRSCCWASRRPRRPRRCPGPALPSAVTPIMLFATMLPVAESRPGDVDAGAVVRGDRVAQRGVVAADLVLRAILDPDAVADVAGVSRAEQVSAAGCDADVVALNQVAVRPDTHDADAVAAVGRDHVAARWPTRRSCSMRSRCWRVGEAARGLDQDPLGPVAVLRSRGRCRRARPCRSGCRGPGCPRRPARSRMPCCAVAADDVVFLGIAAADGGVGREQDHALLGVALAFAVKATLFGEGRGAPVVRVDGIDEVIADEVALDQVADDGIAVTSRREPERRRRSR